MDYAMGVQGAVKRREVGEGDREEVEKEEVEKE